MSDTPPIEDGLFASLRRMLQTLRHLFGDRIELFLLELKEQRLRMFDALLLGAVCGICALMTLVLVTFTIIVVFWEDHRVLVLALLTLAYAAGAVGAFCSVRRRLRQWQSFSATLDQLKKDRECLETEN